MVKNNRLAPILNQYKEMELGPDKLSGLEMGYIYEELLRRFSEQSGEEAGEHFTPREVIRLMVELLEIPNLTGIFPSTTLPAAQAAWCPLLKNTCSTAPSRLWKRSVLRSS